MNSIGSAHREAGHGRTHVIWRDRHRIVTGAAQAVWHSPASLIMPFQIEERDYYEAGSGEAVFAIVWKGSQEDNKRPFAVCPRCERHVDTLVYVDDWICGADRLGLRHRSAMLSKEVRWSEALADVQGLLGVDRALGTMGKAHQVRCTQRDVLLDRLRHRPVTANALLLARVTAEWVPPVPMTAPS